MPPSEAVPDVEVLRCAGILKIYLSPTGETHALRGVDATFRAGTATAIAGPFGSGKSSLLGVLALQERQDGGELSLPGRITGGLRMRQLLDLRRRHVAWVAQRPTHSLFPHLSAADQLAQAARLRGAAADEAAELLEALGLAHRAPARTHQLSGGEQQRLALGQRWCSTSSRAGPPPAAPSYWPPTTRGRSTSQTGC